MTMTDIGPQLRPLRRARLERRAQLLAGASVTYNLVEAAIAISAGFIAGSVALVGFGLDSIVEVSSGLIILWQFHHALPEIRERQALRLMALAFFALAAYISIESVHALAARQVAEHSTVGLVLAGVSLVVMPALSLAQRRTGQSLSSASVMADGTQTLLCTYLSAVLLVGLVLNLTLGWWWADPIAGLVIAAVAVREGREAWLGENCCQDLPASAPTGAVVSTVVHGSIPRSECSATMEEAGPCCAQTVPEDDPARRRPPCSCD